MSIYVAMAALLRRTRRRCCIVLPKLQMEPVRWLEFCNHELNMTINPRSGVLRTEMRHVENEQLGYIRILNRIGHEVFLEFRRIGQFLPCTLRTLKAPDIFTWFCLKHHGNQWNIA